KLLPTSEQLLQAVGSTPGAVAAVLLGPAEAALAAGVPVRLVPLGGVAPTPENVRTGTYPLARPLSLVTRDPPSGSVQAFLDFARSDQVQDLLRKYSVVP